MFFRSNNSLPGLFGVLEGSILVRIFRHLDAAHRKPSHIRLWGSCGNFGHNGSWIDPVYRMDYRIAILPSSQVDSGAH
jgi:hypothetical protein